MRCLQAEPWVGAWFLHWHHVILVRPLDCVSFPICIMEIRRSMRNNANKHDDTCFCLVMHLLWGPRWWRGATTSQIHVQGPRFLPRASVGATGSTDQLTKVSGKCWRSLFKEGTSHNHNAFMNQKSPRVQPSFHIWICLIFISYLKTLVENKFWINTPRDLSLGPLLSFSFRAPLKILENLKALQSRGMALNKESKITADVPKRFSSYFYISRCVCIRMLYAELPQWDFTAHCRHILLDHVFPLLLGAHCIPKRPDVSQKGTGSSALFLSSLSLSFCRRLMASSFSGKEKQDCVCRRRENCSSRKVVMPGGVHLQRF